MPLKHPFLILICFISLVLAVGCGPSKPPLWLDAKGHGLEAPWLSPGKAQRRAREAAVDAARLRLWNAILDLPVSGEAIDLRPPSDLLEETEDWSVRPGAQTATSSPQQMEQPVPAIVLEDAGLTSPSVEQLTDKERLLDTPEVYSQVTVEQLAAISPPFRAQLQVLFHRLEPVSVQPAEDGEVVAEMRVDVNRVLEMARRYLEQEKVF